MIEWLLNGAEAFGDGDEVLRGRGINGLKDVVNVRFQVLEPIPGEESNGHGTDTEGSDRKERWVCPITRKELGPGVRAVYLVPCGCAFAESAIKETTTHHKEGEGAECLQCGKHYNRRDVININPSFEIDIVRLQTRINDLTGLGLAHSLKKVLSDKPKKRKNKDNGEANTVTNGEPKGSKSVAVMSNIKHSATASLTNKVLADERERAKVRKLEMSESVKSLFKDANDNNNRDRAKGQGGGDFMTRGYTLPKRG